MLMLSLICLLVGAVLGQRFKVQVLIPAMALGVTAAAGLAHASTFWQILGAVLVATTSLQIGYLGMMNKVTSKCGHSRRLRPTFRSRRPSTTYLISGLRSQ